MGIREFRGRDHFLIDRVQASVADIVFDGPGEEMRVLQDHGKRPAEVLFFDSLDVNAVICDPALADVIEAVQEIGDGGFPGSGGAHQGNFLSGAGIEADIMQDFFSGSYPKETFSKTTFPFTCVRR